MSNNNENNDNNETQSFGVVSWDELSDDTEGFDTEFMKFQNGENRVRFVTLPFKYWVHKYKEHPDDDLYPDNIKCSNVLHNECPLCEQNFKLYKRWYVGVIDRSTQTYKIMDISDGLMFKIKNYTRDKDWGPPSEYDISIVKNSKADPNNYYSPVPKPKVPLSPQDLEIKKSVDLENLKRLCTPFTPDKVRDKIQSYKDKKVQFGKKNQQREQRTTNVRERGDAYVDSSENKLDNDEYTFPPRN